MKRLSALLCAVMVAICNVGLSMSARAQGSGLGLEISPVRGDIVVEGGKEGSVRIKLTNNVAGPVRARMTVNDFTPNENGEVQLLDDSVKGNTSIKDLVVIPQDVPLGTGESANVDVQVSVPAAQAPGTYYGVLKFDALPQSEESNAEATTGVTLGASLGYVLIIEVPGNLTEAMSIAKVLPERNGVATRLLAASPEFLDVTVNNSGQTLLKPSGVAQVFDFRNREVMTLAVNDGDTKINVLPQNKRVLKTDAKGKRLLPGRYKVVTVMTYGKTGQTVDLTTTFWVLPPLFVALLVAILVAIFVFIAYSVRRFRSKQQRHRR